jgi:hypothetical protein
MVSLKLTRNLTTHSTRPLDSMAFMLIFSDEGFVLLARGGLIRALDAYVLSGAFG